LNKQSQKYLREKLMLFIYITSYCLPLAATCMQRQTKWPSRMPGLMVGNHI